MKHVIRAYQFRPSFLPIYGVNLLWNLSNTCGALFQELRQDLYAHQAWLTSREKFMEDAARDIETITSGGLFDIFDDETDLEDLEDEDDEEVEALFVIDDEEDYL